ncbi:hypothetical protein ACIF70_08785 [Actinacidiphila glaucinigra]|uniref:hypothetical protein n=1 Tax=Actinacidiphila glaucinigra TaxID=235986 RepID=UPI0037C911C6
MAEPAPADAGLGLVAVTPPGHGRGPAPRDLSIGNHARLLGRIAAGTGCDVVAGHGLRADIALEMTALGEFSGPLALLSPVLPLGDEARELALLDRLAHVPVPGTAAWTRARSPGVNMPSP